MIYVTCKIIYIYIISGLRASEKNLKVLNVPGQASVHELTSEAPSGRATPVRSSSQEAKRSKRVQIWGWNIMIILWNINEYDGIMVLKGKSELPVSGPRESLVFGSIWISQLPCASTPTLHDDCPEGTQPGLNWLEWRRVKLMITKTWNLACTD